VEHNPAGSKPDSVSPQNQPVNGLINAQDESLGHINHTCRSVGIEYVLITDEDVLMALEGDTRLKSLTRPQLEVIKERIQDGLMEHWENVVMESIDSVMGEAPDECSDDDGEYEQPSHDDELDQVDKINDANPSGRELPDRNEDNEPLNGGGYMP